MIKIRGLVKNIGMIFKGEETVGESDGDPGHAMIFCRDLDTDGFLARLKQLVPIGFFKGDKLKQFIARQLEIAGQPDQLDRHRSDDQQH